MAGEERSRRATLVGQARIVRGGGRGAGGRLRERASSTWSRANDRGWSGGTVGAGGEYLEGGEQAADSGGSRRVWGLGSLAFVFRGVHLPIFRGWVDWGNVGGLRVDLCALGVGRA